MDSSALDGVPQYMVRKARVVTGSDDPAELRSFVLANVDQPDEFWATEERAQAFAMSRSNSLVQDTMYKLGQAPRSVLHQLGISPSAAASLQLARSLSAPSRAAMLPSPSADMDAVLVPVPEDEDLWNLMPVPEDDDLVDLDEVAQHGAASSRWKTVGHLIRAAVRLGLKKGSKAPSTEFGELADAITSCKDLRAALDNRQASLAQALRQSQERGEEDWLKQLDAGDFIEVLIPNTEPSTHNGVSVYSVAPETLEHAERGRVQDWISGSIQSTIRSGRRVVEIEMRFDPSALPDTSPLFDNASSCQILVLQAHDRGRRAAKRLIETSDASEMVPVTYVKCKSLTRLVRIPGGSVAASASWIPLALREGSKVEVFVQMRTCAKLQLGSNSVVYAPFQPSPSPSRWLEGKVSAVIAWISGSQLLEVALPNDADFPVPEDLKPVGLPSMLLWNISPALDERCLRETAKHALTRAKAAGDVTVIGCRFMHGAGDAPTALITFSSGLEPAPAKAVLTELQSSISPVDSETSPIAKWFGDLTFVLRPALSRGSSGSRTGGATMSSIPGRTEPSLLVCLNSVPKNVSCAASAELAASAPKAMIDRRISYRQPEGGWIAGDVVSYVTRLEKHVLLTSPDSVQLVDLHKPNFIVDPVLPEIELHSTRVLARPGTNLRSCIVCYTDIEMKSNLWAEFCYENYHVDGHQVDVTGSRHPRKMCTSCLKTHCEIGLKEGKLYVNCPMEKCGRALQVRELRDIVDEQVYDTLMDRLRELETKEHTSGEDSALQAAGLELRLCPRCNVRIEKNEGCDNMQCYRCGLTFAWSSAEEFVPRLPDVQPAPEQDEEQVQEVDASSAFGIVTGSSLGLFGWQTTAGARRSGQPGSRFRARQSAGYPGTMRHAIQRVNTDEL